MAFADMFSAENVGNIMSDPRMQLGLALMSQSGNGTPGQVGRAGLGASQSIAQQQHAQQLQAYRAAQMQQMQANQQLQQQAAQFKADQQQRQQDAFSDPEFLATLGPMARLMAQHGLDPQQIIRAQGVDNLQAHRQASLAQQQSQFDTRQARVGAGGSGAQSSGPRMRALPTLIPEHLPDGRIQDHRLNPQTGEFEPFGSPYSKYAPGRAKTNKAVDAVADELAPAPDLGALPGQGSLGSYAPQATGPVGVMPMTAGGSLPQAKAKPSQAQYPGAPAVGTVKKGYRYNGGNPADPASWSKA